MLTASELTAMRSTLDASLPDSAIIQDRAWLSDGGGGGSTTYVASGTIACRIAPAAMAGERIEGDRIHPDTEYVFTFPYDAAVEDDSVISLDSRTYSVVALRAPRSWPVSLRVEAKEVT